MNLNSVRKSQAALALFFGASLPYLAVAQTAPAPTPGDQEVKMEKFVVTGSNIPQAADALAIPVATIDSVVIQNSGVSGDTLDLLRKVAPNISGIGEENAQIYSGATFGGASVNIKGLATLVLINGRRVSTNPAEGAGGYQFVDLNMIPPAAVDRIEVLEDGASAIYGSDAVGGVINIILKKNYNGWDIGGHYGFSTAKGHYEERSGYLVGGVSTGKTSITVAVDYSQHKQLYLSDRPYTNPIYGTFTFPGSIEIYNNLTQDDQFYRLAPGKNAPPTTAGGYTIDQLVSMGVYVPKTADETYQTFNLADGETMIGSLKRYSAMVNLEHKIFGDNLVLFGDVLATKTKTWSQLNAQPLIPFIQDPWLDVNVFAYPSSPPPAGTTFIPVTAPTNPFSRTFLDMGQTTPESAPQAGDGGGYEIYVRSRFVDYPRLYQQDSTQYRVVAGLKGDVSDDLHWETAANINRSTLDHKNPGVWDTNGLQAALASGQINPFAIVQAAGAFNGVAGTAYVHMVSTLNSFDFKIDGTPVELPGGKLGFAVGGSAVRETLSAVPDANSLPNSTGTTIGWSDATTYDVFNNSRDFQSIFAEINVPVTGAKQSIAGAHAIDVDAAVRFDVYSGQVGSTLDPQINLSWQPVDDQFKLRASTGKSFIAPTLYDLYGPISSGSTDSITYTSVGGASKSAQFNQTGGANPALKPTTANSWSAGFVYTPKEVKNFSITVDYSQIAEKQIVGTVPADTIIQDVETNGAASPYINDVHFNSPNGPSPTAPGGISSHSQQSIYVILNSLNLAGQKINSTDMKLDYIWNATDAGQFELSSTWTWYNSYKLQLIPTEQYYNYVGQASKNETTIPRWRTYTTLDWKKGWAEAFVGTTYVSSVTDVGVGGDNQNYFERVPSFVAFDLGASIDFSHIHLGKVFNALKISVGVNNVADRMPPLAVNAFPDTNADVGTYDGAIGRMYYVNADFKF